MRTLEQYYAEGRALNSKRRDIQVEIAKLCLEATRWHKSATIRKFAEEIGCDEKQLYKWVSQYRKVIKHLSRHHKDTLDKAAVSQTMKEVMPNASPVSINAAYVRNKKPVIKAINNRNKEVKRGRPKTAGEIIAALDTLIEQVPETSFKPSEIKKLVSRGGVLARRISELNYKLKAVTC